MAVVSVSMPDNLLEAVDTYAEQQGYSGRSEIIRAGVRSVLSDSPSARNSEVRLVTIVALFEYGDAKVERQIASTCHRYPELVIADTHGHIDGCCFELIAVYGSGDDRAHFIQQLRSISGMLAVERAATGVTGSIALSTALGVDTNSG
ncbi:CopG family ribbon-helix-helix protein [Natronocalculus amylovorans]|uniref:CopG family ribbon-helix-helix protein n=1 Tax=Natronocalculus amylovorans TaxID=2917812 RepID=A0AAE3FVZ1_9EURY|nr:CopG family ribbon-helix-helix protein [Natronocalculus amylovorans]MCL9816241.1 CopG family ribbon-helix-helix protein [Natronocalculus amylovorans]